MSRNLKRTWLASLCLCSLTALTACQTTGESLAQIKSGINKAASNISTATSSSIAFLDRKADEIFTSADEEPAPALDRKDDILAGNCPPISLVEDLESLNKFEDGTAATPDSMTSGIAFTGIEGRCHDFPEKMTVDLVMDFTAEIGPGSGEQMNSVTPYSYPYFVAVTDNSGRILSKKMHSVSLSYPEGLQSLRAETYAKETVLLDEVPSKDDIRILVGFQLSEAQLAYNREYGSTPSMEPTVITALQPAEPDIEPVAPQIAAKTTETIELPDQQEYTPIIFDELEKSLAAIESAAGDTEPAAPAPSQPVAKSEPEPAKNDDKIEFNVKLPFDLKQDADMNINIEEPGPTND